jgi:hypothetical protein
MPRSAGDIAHPHRHRPPHRRRVCALKRTRKAFVRVHFKACLPRCHAPSLGCPRGWAPQ